MNEGAGRIDFLNLKKVNEQYQDEFAKAYVRFIDSGWYIWGKELRKFEKEFALYCNSKFCIGISNGLDSLTIILRAYKQLGRLAEGDEIIVPANTFIATILSVIEAGFSPVFVEPSLQTYNIDPSLVEASITKKTQVIIAVHLYGRPAEISPLSVLADRYKLLLIEDSAQAHGALYKGKKAGSLGDAAAFSFYPGKNLGALGDGGAITTSNEELAKICRAISNYGSSEKYVHDYPGMNARLDEIQAAFLRIKLKGLDRDNTRRQEIAKRYIEEIDNYTIELPSIDDVGNSVWHLFVIRTADRDDLIKHLDGHQISAFIHYPIPPHKQKGLAQFQELSFPVTEKIHCEVLSIPISPVMTDQEVLRVIECLNSYKGKK